MRTSISLSIIETHQLTVQRGSKCLLSGISVSLAPGLTFLIGKNGSGKTTLLRCLAHLIPFSGDIHWMGTSMAGLTPRERATRMAVVHQRLHTPQHLTLREFIRMGRYPYQAWWQDYSAEDRKKVSAALERMNLTDLSDRRLDEISGGEWQRGLLARALVQEAPLWLFDEPAAFLDPLAKQELYQMLREFAAGGQHILCATHDAFAFCGTDSRVWALKEGELLMESDAFAGTEAEMQAVFG